MPCLLKYSDDHTQFTLVLDDGSEFDPEDVSEEGIVLIEDGDDGKLYECVLENYQGPLEPDTVYQLSKLTTQVSEGQT